MFLEALDTDTHQVYYVLKKRFEKIKNTKIVILSNLN